jgi:type II secretory pathway component GspD/PulD (secretin)
MKNISLKSLVAFSFATLVTIPVLNGADIPGIPRDSNIGNTSGYDSTRVEAKMVVNVKDETKKIHFIRDNNDPRVVTKTYILKNVDAYLFRDYIRQMVQSKRVGNTTLQQTNPTNSANKPFIGNVTSTVNSSTNAQPTYNPQIQLGSNTAVECLKYVDGTGLLIVSAEEYRFKDSSNGIGIDKLVEILDDPKLGVLSYGSQMFIYMPKYVPARNLAPMIQNMGMNISDVTELWQGQDIVAYDSGLNWLIFDVSNYSCYNIAAMLKQYDVPIPQMKLTVKVYEIANEDDEKIGLDWQGWKNNQGSSLFSGGGIFRNNWQATYSGTGVQTDKSIGSQRTSFYNFNPRWNTRFLDFLTAKGLAKVAHTGEIIIRNSYSGSLSRTYGIVYINSSNPVSNVTSTNDNVALVYGPYKLLSQMANKDLKLDPANDIPVGKGQTQISTVSNNAFGFSMNVKDVTIGKEETFFNVELSNSSLLGFQSNGSPRISSGNSVSLKVSLPNGVDSFVIGGLTKEEVVESQTGIPYLCDIPYIGWMFGSKSKSIKHSKLIVTASVSYDECKDVSHHMTSVKSKKGRPQHKGAL